MGDRAEALEDEERGRANEKSGAKTKKLRERERERYSGEETGVRGGSEAGHSGDEVAVFFSLTHWRFRIPKNAIHPSNLSLSRWFSRCPVTFQSISRRRPPLRESVHVLPLFFILLFF